ncbi:hypothetical protein EDB85DRAFT_1981770 [Lactarius pseudohatsudake]|nr:hypothetical protein EDB85DRAFT_1981770 [Lactarius pseudohatsudake]
MPPFMCMFTLVARALPQRAPRVGLVLDVRPCACQGLYFSIRRHLHLLVSHPGTARAGPSEKVACTFHVAKQSLLVAGVRLADRLPTCLEKRSYYHSSSQWFSHMQTTASFPNAAVFFLEAPV